MPVIVSDSNNPAYDGNLSTTNGFYQAEAYNISACSNTALTLTTTRYINVTFANPGNCQGIILGLYAAILYNAGLRGVIVTLQENTGSWVDRVSKTLTCAEINPEHTDGGNSFVGMFVPFKFDTPYAVDASAAKWRFKIEQSAGSISAWGVITSDAANPSYVTWCDTQVTSQDDDTLVVADKVTIDKSITLKGLAGTGDTTKGICGWICRSNDLSKQGICLLEWKNPPDQSYTLTLGGCIIVGSFSGFRCGDASNRIPNAQQAIITRKATVDYGTATPGFLQIVGTSTSRPRSKTALFLYGEIPIKPYGVLAQDAAISQAQIVMTEDLSTNGGWAPNDYVFVGKQDVIGQGTTPWQQIQSISGTTITLTSNLLTNIRKAGGTVLNRDRGWGINIKGTASNQGIGLVFTNPCYAEISGCKFDEAILFFHDTLGYYQYPPLPANRDQIVIEDNLAFTQGTTSGQYSWITNIAIINNGAKIQRNLTHRTCLCFVIAGYNTKAVPTNPVTPGTLIFKNNRTLAQFSYGIGYPGNGLWTMDMEDNVFENSANTMPFFFIQGLNSIIKNNVFWGSANLTSSYANGALGFYLNNCVGVRSEGNYFDKNSAAIGGIGTMTVIDFQSKNDKFGTVAVNTSDLYFYGANYYDIKISSPTGTLSVDETGLLDSVGMSKVCISAENDVANVDRVITPLGKFQRCGDSLTDTTVHTSGSGKFSLRFEPLDSVQTLNWEQYIPTGNIQSLTMAVSVWVKISSITYYANTHVNPTLVVDYDNGTEVSAVASNSTDWQLLTCSFTPATTYGRIKVTVKGATDAATTDAYFYVDDMSVFLPPGIQLNLGGMDLWADALPITPSIATNVPAADVWNISTSLISTAGTIGKLVVDDIDAKLSDVKAKTDLIPSDPATETTLAIIRKLTGNKITRSGDIITIYEDDGVTIWKTFNVASKGRVET